MPTLASAIQDLTHPNGGIQKPIYDACAEIINYVNGQAAKGHCSPITHSSWYNPASTPEHHVPGFALSKGCSNDFMTGDHKTQDILNDYVWANRARLGVCWIISRDRIRSTSPGKPTGWQADPGAGHFDHSHVNFGRLVGNNGYTKYGVLKYVGPGKLAPIKTTPVKKPAAKPAPPGWYHVDPAKVSSVLLGLSSAGKTVTKRKAKFVLYLARWETRFGRKNGVTNYGTYYAASYLKKGKK